MLQIAFIVQTDSVIVVTKIKEAYADILKMNVVLSQNINVNIVRNLCSGRVHYKSIKLFVSENMFFRIILSMNFIIFFYIFKFNLYSTIYYIQGLPVIAITVNQLIPHSSLLHWLMG